MNRSIQLLISIILILSSISLFYLNSGKTLFLSNLRKQETSIADQIDQLVKQDFQSLLQKNELPVLWFQVANYKVTSKESYSYALSNKQNSFKEIFSLIRDENKNHYAEIEMIDVISESDEALFILQISIFNIKTKNKVFEISRKYNFNDLGKKKPD